MLKLSVVKTSIYKLLASLYIKTIFAQKCVGIKRFKDRRKNEFPEFIVEKFP